MLKAIQDLQFSRAPAPRATKATKIRTPVKKKRLGQPDPWNSGQFYWSACATVDDLICQQFHCYLSFVEAISRAPEFKDASLYCPRIFVELRGDRGSNLSTAWSWTKDMINRCRRQIEEEETTKRLDVPAYQTSPVDIQERLVALVFEKTGFTLVISENINNAERHDQVRYSLWGRKYLPPMVVGWRDGVWYTFNPMNSQSSTPLITPAWIEWYVVKRGTSFREMHTALLSRWPHLPWRTPEDLIDCFLLAHSWIITGFLPPDGNCMMSFLTIYGKVYPDSRKISQQWNHAFATYPLNGRTSPLNGLQLDYFDLLNIARSDRYGRTGLAEIESSSIPDGRESKGYWTDNSDRYWGECV